MNISLYHRSYRSLNSLVFCCVDYVHNGLYLKKNQSSQVSFFSSLKTSILANKNSVHSKKNRWNQPIIQKRYLSSSLPHYFHNNKDSPVATVSHKLSAESMALNQDDLKEKKSTPNIFAVVTVAGTQFKVTIGDLIIVNKVYGDAGDTYNFEHVLLVATKEKNLYRSSCYKQCQSNSVN